MRPRSKRLLDMCLGAWHTRYRRKRAVVLFEKPDRDEKALWFARDPWMLLWTAWVKRSYRTCGATH